MASFERFDVVVVPFPFTGTSIVKRRPALSLVTAAFVQAHAQAIFAMITSARHSHWPSDVPLVDPGSAGLRVPSIVRWKLFTLPEPLVERRLGRLATDDITSMTAALRRLFGQ